MKRWGAIAGILLVTGALGYGVYVQVLKWHDQTMDESLEKKRVAWQQESDRLEKEIAELRDKLALEEEPAIPEQKLREVFGDGAAAGAAEVGESRQEEVDRKVGEFFSYLDGKDYIKAYDLKQGTFEVFASMGDRLAEHPPAVSAELKDPFLLIRNVAHFYRVLGKRDLRMAREVFLNEAEIAEPVGAVLFEWLLPGDDVRDSIEGRPSLGDLYEYAGFFLNSVGGRSYLLRREPRIRILTTYYSLLIVDRAIQEERNRHGIDIRPHIDSVIQEVRNQRGLVYQKDYLDTLANLQKKYANR